MGVTEVARGSDLLSSTLAKRFTRRACLFSSHLCSPPTCCARWQRLSKRNHDSDLGVLRDQGKTLRRNSWLSSSQTGLAEKEEPLSAVQVVNRFSWMYFCAEKTWLLSIFFTSFCKMSYCEDASLGCHSQAPILES